MKKLNRKSASPPPPLFKKTYIYTILPPPFFNFSYLPPPGKAIKIYFLGWWVRTMIGNYNYWNSLSKCIKLKIFLVFTIIYSKLTWMLWKQFCLGNNLPTHIRENTDFSREKPQRLLSAEANFKDCLMVKSHMTLILLLYCLKR